MSNDGGSTPVSLGKTLRALLILQIQEMPQKRQVEVLDRAGFGQTEIAEIIGSTSKSVSVRLAEIRKAKKGRG